MGNERDDWFIRPQFCTRPERNWANEMTIVMNHAPGAGSIARGNERFIVVNNVQL